MLDVGLIILVDEEEWISLALWSYKARRIQRI